MPQGGTNLIGGPITLIPSEEEEEELIGGEITLIPTPSIAEEKELTGQEKIYERLRKRKEAEKEAEGRSAEIEREQAARAREWYEKIPELERDERERKHWETQKRLAPFYREIAQDRKAWVDKVTRLSETLPLASEEDRRKEARSLAKEEEDALIRKLDEFEGEFGLRFKHFGKSLDAIEMDQEVGTAMAKARTALGGKTVGPAPPRSPYGAFRSSEAARKLWGPEVGYLGEYKPMGSKLDKHGLISGLFESPLDIPEIREEDVKTLFPGGGVGRDVAVGILNAVNGLTESIVSPGGAATMGFGVVAKEAPAILRAGHGAFSLDLTRNVIEHHPELMRILENPDVSLQDKTEAFVGQALLTLFAGGAMKGALKSEFKSANVKTPTQAMKVYRESVRRKKAEPKPIEEPKVREREVLEKLPDESWPDFYARVGEQQLLFEHQRGTGVEPTAEGAPKTSIGDALIKDTPIRPEVPLKEPPPLKEVPLPKDPEMALDVPLRKDIPLPKDPEMAKDVPVEDALKADLNQVVEALRSRESRGGEVKQHLLDAMKKGEAVKAAKAGKVADLLEIAKRRTGFGDTGKGGGEGGGWGRFWGWLKGEDPEVAGDKFRMSLWDRAITSQVTSFRPATALQRSMEKFYGVKEAGAPAEMFFEFLPGSYAKAKERVLSFDEAVSVPLKESGLSKEFGVYSFLKRMEDRLKSGKSRSDQIKEIDKEIKGAKELFAGGAEYARKERRGVDDYIKDLEEIKSNLKARSDKRVAAFLEDNGEVQYWTPKRVRDTMELFKKDITPEQFKKLEEIGGAFRTEASKMMDTLVKGGIISKEQRIRIELSNEHYTPWMLEKYLKDEGKATGLRDKVGREKLSLHRVTGIDDPAFTIADVAETMRNKLHDITVIVEYNKAKREFVDIMERDLKDMVVGPEGEKTNVGGVEAFMQKLGKKKETPPGMGEFTVIRNGNVERYAVDSGVAEAINSFGEKQHAAWRLLAHTSRPLKVGATKWSAPFQIVNALLSDLPTNALTARTGLRVNPIDWARFIAVDYPVAFARAFMGNMGKPGDFYREAARSGLTGQTLKNAIDPDYNLVGRLPRFDGMLQGTTVERGVQGFEKGARWIDVIPDAIEEMGKLVGIERALRQERGLGFFEKVPKIKDKNGRYIRNMERFFEENPEWRREVMKQMGSPQFSVSGKWGRQMDALFMFYNARMQGAARDLQRVTDLKSPEGRKAVARMMGAVVLPTVWHAINNQRDYREDYLNTSQQERDNYWIFFKESFVAAHGTDIEKMNLVKSLDKDGNGLILEDEIPAHLRKFFKRDAIKLPKRDLLRGVANIAEGFVNMAFEKDPDYTIGKAVADIGWRAAGDFGPLEIGSEPSILGAIGGAASQANPALKYVYEIGQGDNIRDSWRKRYLIPERKGVTPDPSEQRKPSTEAGYIAAANLYGGSPIRLKHAVETWTADLIGQFVPKRKVKGRKYYDSETLNHIKGMFLSRFVASNFMVDERRQKYLEKKLKEDATQAMKANRIAGDWVEENVKDIDAEDVGNFGTSKASELWLKMHRDYGNLGEFSEDTRIRTAIQNRLNGIQKKLTWDEKTSLSLTPMKRAELYLKDFNERWPTPAKELDQASKNQRELEQLQWRNYLTGTGFLNGATERALVNIAVEEGSQKKK